MTMYLGMSYYISVTNPLPKIFVKIIDFLKAEITVVRGSFFFFLKSKITVVRGSFEGRILYYSLPFTFKIICTIVKCGDNLRQELMTTQLLEVCNF